MKGLIVLAIILAIVGVGCLIATLFIEGDPLIWVSIGAGLSLAAFIVVLVAYANKAAN